MEKNQTGAYFLRRLTTANTINPNIRPAMIDSHGKPGIGGSVIGVDIVEVELVDGVLTTVVVWTEVLTDVLTEVLTMVVVNELVVVAGGVDVELLKLDDVEATLVVVPAGVDDVVVTGAPAGGSRWNIIPSDPAKGGIVLGLPAVVPTANPLISEPGGKTKELSLPTVVNGMGGIMATLFHNVPS